MAVVQQVQRLLQVEKAWYCGTNNINDSFSHHLADRERKQDAKTQISKVFALGNSMQHEAHSPHFVSSWRTPRFSSRHVGAPLVEGTPPGQRCPFRTVHGSLGRSVFPELDWDLQTILTGESSTVWLCAGRTRVIHHTAW